MSFRHYCDVLSGPERVVCACAAILSARAGLGEALDWG